MTKIGIYSGTFDPIHNGHMLFAATALEQCGLDRVMFMVEPQPRRKQGVKALEHRQNMVSIAIADKPRLGSILLDHSQFTIDKTLPVLQTRFSNSELHFMLGDDVLDTLIHWPHLHVLIASCSFIVGVRTKKIHDIQHTMQVLAETIGRQVDYDLIALPNNTVSSSSIRKHIKQGKLPKDMDRKVLEYIQEQGLYASFTSGAT